MFAMGAATRIYVATGATDMRKSFVVLKASFVNGWSAILLAATFFGSLIRAAIV